MPVSHAVRALTQKHASIQGDILSLEHQLNDLNEKLNVLEISIRIFEPEYKLQKIRAKGKVQRLSGLTKGEIPKLVGDYVGLADKDFMINDLVDHIFELKSELCTSIQAAINPHGPLSPKMLGANAHLASYPIGRNLKIEWDNIDAIIAYFAENMYNKN